MSEEHGHDHEGRASGEGVERPRVLVFFDYACPFCHVDYRRFETLKAEMDFEMVLVPFELRPGLTDPIDLEAEGSGHSGHVDEHLERISEKEGVPYSPPRMLPNTHRAIVLGEIARDQGDTAHRTVHRAIFDAYFGEGRDIGSEETLIQIGSQAGLSREEIEAAWEDGSYDDRIHQFRHLALHIGLDGTPAALICNELLIGSRPAGVLREALEKCDSRLEAIREGVMVADEPQNE